MNPTNPTFIRDIRPYQLNFRIRTRVSRIWRPKNYDGDRYEGLHYILIDEKGDSIHAVIEEHDYPLTHVYDIFRFYTRNYQLKFKVVNHNVQLRFNELTEFEQVRETSAPIPKYAFQFLQFNKLKESMDNQTVLADAYGCIKSIIPERQVFVKDKNQWESICEIVLENLRREDLKITLWGDVARGVNLETVQKLPPPVLAVFTSLKLTEFDGNITASGRNHTCIIINPQIQEAADYQAEFSKPGDRVKVATSLKETTSEKAWKSVSELNALNPESYMKETVYCRASIRRFPTHNGWWYRCCSTSKCFKQLKQKQNSDQFFCVQHGLQTPLPCYRVYMTIEDSENQATLTLMGNQAECLFGFTCQDLLKKTHYQTQQALPEEMEKIIGKSYLFEIKVNLNGELLVKNVFPDPKIAHQDPIIVTPDRLPHERKRTIDTSSRALFISEPEKGPKRQLKEAESSSTKDQHDKEKID